MTIIDPDTQRGLYGKYYVRRERITPNSQGVPNGTIWSDPGECFVLAYATDPHAKVALAAHGADQQAIEDNSRAFHVSKNNGKPTGPRFVLTADDPRAVVALRAYAESCVGDYAPLATDVAVMADRWAAKLSDSTTGGPERE